MDPAQVARAHDCHTQLAHAALLRSRARPCLPSCCCWMKASNSIDLRHELVVAAQDFAGMIEPDFGAIQQAMGFGQAVDDFG